MGIFGFLDRYAESGSPFSAEWKRISGLGDTAYNYGGGLTDEGVGGLRDLRKTYASRQNDPLGSLGRGIFARARGTLADDFTRTVNAGGARRRQLSTQSGGALTPEQIAALDAEDRRGAGEGLFAGENDLASTEASMTLSEAGKLFDRMEGIDRTITSVGQDERNRGLSAILAGITGRQDRMKAIADTFSRIYGASKGGG